MRKACAFRENPKWLRRIQSLCRKGERVGSEGEDIIIVKKDGALVFQGSVSFAMGFVQRRREAPAKPTVILPGSPGFRRMLAECLTRDGCLADTPSAAEERR